MTACPTAGLPACGAPKLMFGPEEAPQPAQDVQPAPALEEDDLQLLPAGALSALCSNLARGCEKQYKDEEAALFARSQITLRRRRPPLSDADQAAAGRYAPGGPGTGVTRRSMPPPGTMPTGAPNGSVSGARR